MICKPNLLWWFLNICPEISHSIYWCTVQKKKGSQNTSLQYLRFLFFFFPPLRTTSLTPNVSVVVFWPCSIFGSGTFHYNVCQKPVKRRHNELFSAFVFFSILGKKTLIFRMWWQALVVRVYTLQLNSVWFLLLSLNDWHIVIAKE